MRIPRPTGVKAEDKTCSTATDNELERLAAKMAENDIITAKKRLQANAKIAKKVETNTIENSAAEQTYHKDSKSVSLPTEKCRKPNPSSSLTVEIPPPMVCATLIYIFKS